MPHWGIAWALGPNYNLDVDDERGKQANAAIAQALTLSRGRSDVERAYIEAMAIRFPTDAKPNRVARRVSTREPWGICRTAFQMISMLQRCMPKA